MGRKSMLRIRDPVMVYVVHQYYSGKVLAVFSDRAMAEDYLIESRKNGQGGAIEDLELNRWYGINIIIGEEE